MANVTDNIAGGFKDIFLAGVGALAIGAEKSKEVIDQLIAKGELTVEQGKELNEELKHKAANAAADVHEDIIAAHMATMTPEQRQAFAAKVAELAERFRLTPRETEILHLIAQGKNGPATVSYTHLRAHET